MTKFFYERQRFHWISWKYLIQLDQNNNLLENKSLINYCRRQIIVFLGWKERRLFKWWLVTTTKFSNQIVWLISSKTNILTLTKHWLKFGVAKQFNESEFIMKNYQNLNVQKIMVAHSPDNIPRKIKLTRNYQKFMDVPLLWIHIFHFEEMYWLSVI